MLGFITRKTISIITLFAVILSFPGLWVDNSPIPETHAYPGQTDTDNDGVDDDTDVDDDNDGILDTEEGLVTESVTSTIFGANFGEYREDGSLGIALLNVDGSITRHRSGVRIEDWTDSASNDITFVKNFTLEAHLYGVTSTGVLYTRRLPEAKGNPYLVGGVPVGRSVVGITGHHGGFSALLDDGSMMTASTPGSNGAGIVLSPHVGVENTGFTSIFGGGLSRKVYGLRPDGSVYYGLTNSMGTDVQHVPALGTGVVKIGEAVGAGNRSFALKSDGTVWGWQSHLTSINASVSQLSLPVSIVQMGVGEASARFLGSDGNIYKENGSLLGGSFPGGIDYINLGDSDNGPNADGGMVAIDFDLNKVYIEKTGAIKFLDFDFQSTSSFGTGAIAETGYDIFRSAYIVVNDGGNNYEIISYQGAAGGTFASPVIMESFTGFTIGGGSGGGGSGSGSNGAGTDIDLDGIDNHIDLDSDNDGIADIYEAGSGTISDLDTNGNGTIDAGDTGGFVDTGILANSTAGNGIDDRVENAVGTAGAGITPVANRYMSLDSDSDGIPDATEARATADYIEYPATIDDAADSDDDGILDIYDSDGASVAGATTFGSTLAGFKLGTRLPNDDSDDSDGIPDFLDTDSDGDTLLDSAESDNPAITGVTYSDPDGNINDPLTTSGSSIIMENTDGVSADVDFRSLDNPMEIDLTAPNVYINSSNVTAFPVSGTCAEAGDFISISIDGTNVTPGPIPTCSGTGFSFTVDASSVGDGTNLDMVALIVDNLGTYTSVSETEQVNKDTVYPTITLDALPDVNVSNENPYPVSGACTATGDTVTLTVTDGAGPVNTSTGSATCSGTGFSLSLNLSGLDDGPINLTGSIIDPAGNTAQDTDSKTKDTILPTLSISPVPDVNAAFTQTSYTITGSCSLGDNNVSLTLSGASPNPSSVACTDDGFGVGEFTTTLDVSGVIEGSGSIVVNASQSDSVGNTGSATPAIATKDVTPPLTPNIDIDTVTNGIDDPIITFSAIDNIGIDYYEITYLPDDNTGSSTGTVTTDSPATSPVTLDLDPDEMLHSVTVTAYDFLGNSSSYTVTFPPIITITAPTQISNTAITDTTIVISSPSMNDITNIVINNATGFTCTGSGGGVTDPYASPVSCTGGTISSTALVDVSAEDDAIGSIGQNAKSYVIETVAPTISITAPTMLSNTGITDTVITVMDDYEISASGVTISPLNPTGGYSISNVVCTQVSTTEVSCSVQIDGVEGTGDIRVDVTDLAGNTGSLDETGYVIDTTVPTVTINTPADAGPANESSYPVTGTCTASGDTVVATISDSDTPTNTLTGTTLCTPTGYSLSFDISPFDDGPLNITVDANDLAGNNAVQATDSANKDTTPPTISVNSSLTIVNSTNSNPYTVTGTCTATGDSITVSVNDGSSSEFSYPTCSGTGYSALLDLSTLNEGTLDITADITDSLNPPVSATGTVEKDSIVLPPLVQTPSSGNPVTGTGEVGATVQVTTSGGSTCTATVQADMTWTCFLSPTAADGETISAIQTDLAGNVSGPGAGVISDAVDTDGDGVSDYIEGLIGTDPTIDDSDSDGTDDDNNDLDNIHPSIELGASNGGDGNGDGTLDAIQNAVASLPNTISSSYNTLEVGSFTGSCNQVQAFSSRVESTTFPDSSYRYDLGLWDFEIACSATGATADIKIYLDQVYNTSTWTYRKFNESTNSYTDISSIVTYTQETVGTGSVTVVNYSITDGGIYDEDGIANGVIIDPSGPGITIPTSSSSSGGGGGGGGGGSTSSKDVCPNGDFTNSRYDDECGTDPDLETSTGETIEEPATGSGEAVDVEVEEEVVDKGDYTVSSEVCPIIDNLLSDTYMSDYVTQFSDINSASSKEEITRLEKTGIVRGRENGLFVPNSEITRAEFLAIVLQAHCYDISIKPETLPFYDVEISHWHSNVIRTGLKYGIVAGDIDENGVRVFRGDDSISKVEAFAIMMNMRKLTLTGDSVDYEHSYTDAAADWQNSYLNTGEALGILKPQDSKNLFLPNVKLVRDDLVGIMFDIMRLY